MERMKFAQLPLLVRIVVGIALVNAWVSFEEFVVDRVGLWKYMPGYRVGAACIWDAVVVTLVVAGIAWASSPGSAERSSGRPA